MEIFYSFWIDIHLYFVIDMVFSYHVMILHNFMVVFCNPWLSKNIVNWGQYLNFVQYYFVGQLYFDHCTQKFKCVLNILFDKQNNLYQRGFLGSAMFNIENTQPSRRWQTLHIIYGNTPRSVSENVLENNIFFWTCTCTLCANLLCISCFVFQVLSWNERSADSKHAVLLVA